MYAVQVMVALSFFACALAQCISQMMIYKSNYDFQAKKLKSIFDSENDVDKQYELSTLIDFVSRRQIAFESDLRGLQRAQGRLAQMIDDAVDNNKDPLKVDVDENFYDITNSLIMTSKEIHNVYHADCLKRSKLISASVESVFAPRPKRGSKGKMKKPTAPAEIVVKPVAQEVASSSKESPRIVYVEKPDPKRFKNSPPEWMKNIDVRGFKYAEWTLYLDRFIAGCEWRKWCVDEIQSENKPFIPSIVKFEGKTKNEWDFELKSQSFSMMEWFLRIR